MNATEYFRAGKLNDAIRALNEEVRNDASDARKRTFLFELLCFAGEYDRGEKQLDVLAQGGRSSELGGMLYRAALQAERQRNDFFLKKEYLQHPAAAGTFSGAFNGAAFSSISDADPRLGARLELFVAGAYMWIPFEHISRIEMQPPRRLRDLLWAPVIVTPSESFPLRELGEVFVPVLSPFSWQHSDDAVRLGRASVWEPDAEGNELPFGQKMLLVDNTEVPFLELRSVEFAATAAAAG